MSRVTKAGIASEKSSQSTAVVLETIITPTITNAGPVAAAGIARNSGPKNSDSRKQIAITTAVNPVLPPTAIPAILSTYVVVVDVPRQAPAVVATASAISMFPIPSTLPSLSTIFAFIETPSTVPTVSKKSTNKNVKTTINISHEKI